jgi:TolB-like protein
VSGSGERPGSQDARQGSRFGEFLGELRRRRVFRAFVVYAVASFAILQVVEPVMHGLHLPEWVLSLIVLLIALGFPLTIGLAWAFDLKTTGIERTRPAAEHPGVAPRSRALVALLLLGLGAVAAGAVFALRGWLRPPPVPPSIAVLPFADMSPGKDQEYLSDGIAEEILTTLYRVEGLRVAGRTSSFYFKGRNARLAEIGRELNVASVLEGGVRRDGNRIRITATIVNVADGYHAWSKSWDRDVGDILAVESEIAREVVDALKVRLLDAYRPAPDGSPVNPDAHIHYLVAHSSFFHGSGADLRRALEAFEQAVALEPGYSRAWAGYALALAYDAEVRPTLEELLREKKRALEAAERAVATGPAVAEGYQVRGFLRAIHRREWAEGRVDIQRAIALGGSAGEGYGNLAPLLAASGRVPEAMDAIQRCTELEPLWTLCWSRQGVLANAMGQFDRARGAFRRALEVNPDHTYAPGYLAHTDVLEGRPGEALSLARGNVPYRAMAKALAYHALGNAKESQRSLDELLAYSHSMAFQIAEVCAFRGDPDDAFKWLELAAERLDIGIWMVKISPFLRPLRGDPRYAAFLKKVNLPVD